MVKQNWKIALSPRHLLHSLRSYPLHHRVLAAKSSNFYAVSHYNIWKLVVFSSVLNPNHCTLVFNSLVCSLHNWRSAVLFCFVLLCFFFQQFYKVSGVLFQSRYVSTLMRCVNLIRCLIRLHPMLSNANPLMRPIRSRAGNWVKISPPKQVHRYSMV